MAKLIGGTRAVAFFSVLLTVGRAHAGPSDPIRARIVNCEPQQFSAPSASSGGYGNSPADRRLFVRLYLQIAGPNDVKTTAIDNTNRIEVCRLNQDTTLDCPGQQGWVFFDKTDPVAKVHTLSPSWVFNDASVAPLASVYTSLIADPDWADLDDANVHLTLRVNGEGTGLQNTALSGFCANWRQLAANPLEDTFRVYGVFPTAKPLNGVLDVCTEGSDIYWQGGGPPVLPGTNTPRNICIPLTIPEWIRNVMTSEDAAHQAQLQGALAAADQKSSSFNGSFPGTSIKFPFRIFAGPHQGNFGNAGLGAFYMEIDDLQNVKASDPPTTAVSGSTLYALSVLTHEYFHEMQGAWDREAPQSAVHIDSYLSESFAASVELNLCLKDFPNADKLPPGDLRNQCISAGKLGDSNGGVYRTTFFNSPELNILQQPYESAVFFRYLSEQFAYPRGTPPHPKLDSEISVIPRDAVDAVTNKLKPLTQRPSSDEGVDIIGLIFHDFESMKGPTSTVLDNSVTNHLGRSLDRVVLDLHTAMVLKDFVDTDQEVPASGGRWRFEWTNAAGYFTNTVLAANKPFTIPSPDLLGPTCNSATGVCDGLTRARRIHDSWEVVSLPGFGTVPIRKYLQPSDTVSSPQPAGIGAYGAAYLGVSVDPTAWGNKKLYFRAQIENAYPLPFFRVFTINQPSPGQWVPTPLCENGDDWICKVFQTSDGTWFLGVPVSITNTTREVLVVASAGSQPAKFSWSFGPTAPSLNILDPIAATPALVGSSSFPRKFSIKLSYRDQDGKPMPVVNLLSSDVKIFAPGCATGGTCEVTNFQLWPISAGSLFVVASLPTNFYPTAPTIGTFDLRVELQGLQATEPHALRYNTQSQVDATVLAMDASGSMNNPPTKIDAARTVAKAVVRSFVSTTAIPTTYAGVVTFNQDASTALPLTGVTSSTLPSFDAAIDGITAAGLTSIGDGLYESQSILAAAFDPNDLFESLDRQSVILVSDGVNSASATPFEYYGSKQVFTEDQNGSWYNQSGPLNRILRLAHHPVPIISTIAIGQDADLSEMDHLAHLGGPAGTMVYVQDSLVFSLFEQVLNLGDSFFQASASASAYERAKTGRVPGGSPLQFPVEPGAQELRVNVVSGLPEAGMATLTSPSGLSVAPTAMDPAGNSTAFRILDPEPGTWLVVTQPIPEITHPIAFVEASLRSPVQLFSTFDTSDRLPLVGDGAPDPEELNAWVGSDLALRAMVIEDEPLTGCSARATITRPDGTHIEVSLLDDGKHDDGVASDGIFGLLYTDTGLAGLYAADLVVECTLPSGALVSREKRHAVSLSALRDLDADGLPDRWEEQFGVTDPSGDADADGLPENLEFGQGTNPLRSDSDGGGEADASEVNSGRNPRDPADDVVGTPELVPIAGNSVVYLPAAMNSEGHSFVVERASNPDGPYAPVEVDAAQGRAYAVDLAAPNDVASCYRMRAQLGMASSGWSTPACITPRVDPVPPRVDVASAPARTHTRDVAIAIRVTDPPLESDSFPPPVDLGVIATGADAVRFWFGSDPPTGIQWQPVSQTLEIRIPDAESVVLNIQARDRAGNLSRPTPVVLTRPLSTAVDRAIALEERATDLLDAGSVDGARSEVAASVQHVVTAFSASLKRLALSKGKDKDELKILVGLAKVHGLKLAAIALLHPKTLNLGRHALEHALDIEIELARFAEEKGIAL